MTLKNSRRNGPTAHSIAQSAVLNENGTFFFFNLSNKTVFCIYTFNIFSTEGHFKYNKMRILVKWF